MAKTTIAKDKIGAWHSVSLTDATKAELDAAKAVLTKAANKVEAMVRASHEVPAGHTVRVSTKFGKMAWAIVPETGGKGEKSDIAI